MPHPPKSFYTLSKAHHPDLHPNDPNASTHFVAISNAYTILGTPAKRAQYDREVLQHPNSNSDSASQTTVHKGSNHSSGPAGGRPASGLSRRRTHFQGPPPSFYRSGGWGDHGAKRAAAQKGSSTSDPSSESSSSNTSSSSSSSSYMNQPYHLNNDVPHFDWREHLRTQENHSRRLRARRRMMGDPRAGEGDVDEGQSSTLVNMLFMGGIVFLAGYVPWVMNNTIWSGSGGGKKRAREG
ncbi:hypothetical protein HYALB_00007517 [Hymenoscyphus albidus]|uniref:J domain-containing protein n=1 Tax=Hymenoscyphus albidus TaxID=595503 RepID=A0A9N9Q762_9HELO|nr:hypothetical protein HYALB_00007517 [Hymenoscyphus albidus]